MTCRSLFVYTNEPAGGWSALRATGRALGHATQRVATHRYATLEPLGGVPLMVAPLPPRTMPDRPISWVDRPQWQMVVGAQPKERHVPISEKRELEIERPSCSSRKEVGDGKLSTGGRS
jgi:hypothetical protein